MIEKDTLYKLSPQKTSVPRLTSVKWDFKAKSNLFTRYEEMHFNDKISINREDTKKFKLTYTQYCSKVCKAKLTEL